MVGKRDPQKDAGIDTRSSHIFVCKFDGRMGKRYAGMDVGILKVGPFKAPRALTAMDLGRQRGV
jgi:hypothetical protein